MGLTLQQETVGPKPQYAWLPDYCRLLQANITATANGVYAVLPGESAPPSETDGNRSNAQMENAYNQHGFDYDFAECRYERNRALAEAVYHLWAEQLVAKGITGVRLFIVDELTCIVNEEDVLLRQELIPTLHMFTREGADHLNSVYDEELIAQRHVLDLATMDYLPRKERRRAAKSSSNS